MEHPDELDMSSRPYLKLYVADYLGDTTHLSTEEHGAYLLLLMAAWNGDGTLPNDHAKLARIARSSAIRWAKIAPAIMGFFHITADGLVNARLQKELEKFDERTEVNRANGKRGADAKSRKSLKPGQANAIANAKPEGQRNASIPESRVQKEESGDSESPKLRVVADNSSEGEELTFRNLLDPQGDSLWAHFDDEGHGRKRQPGREHLRPGDCWFMAVGVLRVIDGLEESAARKIVAQLFRANGEDPEILAAAALATYQKFQSPDGLRRAQPFFAAVANSRGRDLRLRN